MEKSKVLEIIDKKIKEHQIEIDGCQNNLLDEKGKLKYKSVPEATKMLIIKDKLMFHKAASLALIELKNEIEQI